jgi:hypothetical protein
MAMTKSKIPMTKEALMTNPEYPKNDRVSSKPSSFTRRRSDFGIRYSFVIRHSTFCP